VTLLFDSERLRRICTVVLGALASNCKSHDCDGNSCGNNSFATEVSFEWAAANRVEIELCRNADCSRAVLPTEAGETGLRVGSAPGFNWVWFSVTFNLEGRSTVEVSAQPKDPAQGNVYTLTILDAASSQLLFNHTEAITYEEKRACAEVCLVGSFSDLQDAGAPLRDASATYD
jgi:hypothetical protein